MNYQLAQFSGYSTATTWKSVVIPVTFGRRRGYIDEIAVLTRPLGAGAAATVVIEANQGVTSSLTKTISGTGNTRFIFSGFGLGGSIQDCRVYVYFSNGSTTNPCKIRSVQIKGHFVES